VVAIDRADANQLNLRMNVRAPERNRVVGVVAHIGVDPQSHRGCSA
jgi:hypothetical protein